MTRELGTAVIGESIKQSIMVQKLEIDLSEETKEFLTKTLQPELTSIDCTDFVKWLLDEVMDEELWEDNAKANGEIICRKLKKLGVLDTENETYYIKAQPVVYCKDCQHNEWCIPRQGRSENDYCSRGEREK